MVKAFVIDNTYRVEGKHAYVYLYGRLEDGKTFLTRNKYQPYFFIKKSDAEQAKGLAANATVKTADRKNFADERLSKVVLDNPRDVPAVRDALVNAGISTYEADVRFTYRFMMDHNIQGSCFIVGKGQPHTFVDVFYDEPEFKHTDYTPTNIRTLALDIETGDRGKKLYCVSLVGSDGYSTVLVVSDTTVPGERIETYATEKACLEAMCAAIRTYDPDIITGWSVVDYDFMTLRALCEANAVPFIIGRSDEPVRIKKEAAFLRESTAQVTGRMVLDGIMLLKTSFVKLEDYKLGTAAQTFLGEDKLLGQTNKLQEIEEAYRTDRQRLAEYCRKDSDLVLRILAKKQLIELTIQRSLLTGMQLDRVKASIASFDNLYLRELARLGYAAPTHSFVEKPEGITGGYVMTSQPGIYDYVIVCDFKSLYPSVMRTLNIDPFSYVPGKRLAKSTKEFVRAENGSVFTSTDGILPSILERLHKARNEAKQAKNPVAVYAIKVLMNSFFGVLASPQCRFFSMEVANAITVTSQYVTKRTAELITEKGFSVIYGDTDSIFVDLDVQSMEDAKRLGSEIEASVNAYWSEECKRRYSRTSRLELQFEKVFVRFFMPLTRSGEASKKRYAGLRIVDGKETIDFTGLEFVRRDWTELAKEFQLAIIDRIFHKQEVEGYVKEYVADLKAGKKDALLIYKKAMRKDITEYTKTTPQHVKAARLSQGGNGNIIEYYVTEDGPQPVDNRTSPINYQHYIEKQLKPIANAALVFYNTSFDDLIAGNSQKSLFQF